MGIHILALFGSPRRGGNTDILMEELLNGISRDGGIDITRIYLCDYDIKPCKACAYCEIHGECCIQDDMCKIYPLLDRSQIIIVSSPVYFFGLSAQCKTMIDRCHIIWARKFVLNEPWSEDDEMVRQGFFISAAGTNNPSLFYGGEMTIRNFFDCLDILYQGAIMVRGVQEKGEVRKKVNALKNAYNKGVELVNPY
ncbi:MAG: flavodoxin family protein [Candidatus Eremiobacteraeota bacterium]|nr:flavodoxin family protein [Candidatus Eremiobacteraeota bacterium]